ncbi:MAG: bifunctional UDP-N-acetylglucosamine diphosphorylase/glucosamine-1-phosphate N-acetyltransferase GlmU [Arsenophonus sp.]|nr:MAG: bifunctional UDP-N-acetylglucosamine diphosphorylase/glucosamine-1-phosphate N-acetyltransferase GlmU [Arsenophonus sp.]
MISVNKTNIIILATNEEIPIHFNKQSNLYLLAGKPIFQYIIETALLLKAKKIFYVYNYNIKNTRLNFINHSIHYIFQSKKIENQNIIKEIIYKLEDNEKILILHANIPLLKLKTLKKLMKIKLKNGIGLISKNKFYSKNYNTTNDLNNNNIINFSTKKIKNKKHIKNIYNGILIIKNKILKKFINKKYEREKNKSFIIKILQSAYEEGLFIDTIISNNLFETYAVNNLFELISLERMYQKELAKNLLLSGVKIQDPNRFDLRGTLKYDNHVIIDSNVIIEGNVFLGKNVHIHTGCFLKNCVIQDNTVIYPFSIIEGSNILHSCNIGPFAHLRTGSKINNKAKIGNFVEIKNTSLGINTQVSHMSYLGDSTIGSNVNIGAGTITCNYNGIKKFKTIIEDDVFIGSDSQLIAPIKIEKNATIGAGTTVTNNVKKNELVLSRIKQKHIRNWKNKFKKE